MKENIILLTGNANKIREAESILGVKVSHRNLELDEIQSLDPKKVVEYKVKNAFGLLSSPVFVWDVSLEFEAVNGFPGPLIKFYWEALGLKMICRIIHLLGNDRATARTTLGYYDGDLLRFFEGVTKGRVPEEPQGRKGWAWDPIFVPEGSEKTFGEMELTEKNKFSMHRKALIKFKEFLNSEEFSKQ